MSERSGGSFWLDAVLYDSAPPKADALLDSAPHEGMTCFEATAPRDASDWPVATKHALASSRERFRTGIECVNQLEPGLGSQ